MGKIAIGSNKKANISNDNYLLRTLKIKIATIKNNQRYSKRTKYKIEKLRNALKIKTDNLRRNKSGGNVLFILKESAERTIGLKEMQRKEWNTGNTRNLIINRRKEKFFSTRSQPRLKELKGRDYIKKWIND